MDSTIKKNLLENSHLKYKEMDPIKKESLLENLRLKYKEIGRINKQNLLENLHLQSGADWPTGIPGNFLVRP